MELPPAEAFRPEPTLTPAQVAERAGVDVSFGRRIWRALGMPDLEDDEVAFGEDEVDAMLALRTIVGLGFSEDEVVTVARVYGTALSRIADVETRLFRDKAMALMRQGDLGQDEAIERLAPIVDVLQKTTSRLLDVGHRRHLAMAQNALRAGESDAASESLAAGFVDLVDFSRISDDLPGEELGGLVDAFEDMAVAVCADAGVRLVKVIGDAVMFVSRTATHALDAARTIVQRADESEVLPQARAGLDFGSVVAVAGDYFGRPVNVAARITAFAYPATVVISREFRDAVGDDGIETSRIGTERLKGVGSIHLYKVR